MEILKNRGKDSPNYTLLYSIKENFQKTISANCTTIYMKLEFLGI